MYKTDLKKIFVKENKSIVELLIVSSIGITSFVFILMVALKK